MRGKEVVGRRRVLRAQQRATPGGRGKRGGGMGGGWAAGWEAAGWAAACLPAACRARPIALGHRVEHGHRAVQVPRARAVVAEHEVARPAAHGARVVVAVQGEAHTRESYAEQEQDPKACLGPWKLLSSGVVFEACAALPVGAEPGLLCGGLGRRVEADAVEGLGALGRSADEHALARGAAHVAPLARAQLALGGRRRRRLRRLRDRGGGRDRGRGRGRGRCGRGGRGGRAGGVAGCGAGGGAGRGGVLGRVRLHQVLLAQLASAHGTSARQVGRAGGGGREAAKGRSEGGGRKGGQGRGGEAGSVGGLGMGKGVYS